MRRAIRIIQCILIFTMFMSLVSCKGDNNNQSEVQAFEKAENIFDNIPLRILINSDKSTDYGIPNTNSLLFSRLRLLNLEAQISKEFEEKFGFPIEFFSIEKREPGQSESNDYRLFFESGESADLIFPRLESSLTMIDIFFGWRNFFTTVITKT
ncbi:MAG TPA: hypothetical protein DDZ89_02015 [Clostridiales bacterium]|nr:hypothetical protein [Clostridiales bacterium]